MAVKEDQIKYINIDGIDLSAYISGISVVGDRAHWMFPAGIARSATFLYRNADDTFLFFG